MTRLLTAPPVEKRFMRPNTDILIQPNAIIPWRLVTVPKPRKRRIDYAKKIMIDPSIMNA